MYPLIVSFFTDDWEYPKHAARLHAECDALRLDHRIERLESAGSYLANTCLKPRFIRNCLQAGRPVLWIDVDGSIIKRPDFFIGSERDYDFQAKRITSKERTRMWHVGTMWFNPTPATFAFVDEWVARTGDMTDESALERTWRSREWNLRTREIPSTYFEIPYNRKPSPDCVIYHRISSSESKKQQIKLAEQDEKLNG